MKATKTRKRIISIFLAIITVVGIISPSFAAFADDGVIGFYDIEIFYEDGTLVPAYQEDGESDYIEYMTEGDKKQFTYQFIDCELPDNGYVKWTSDTPTVCDVTPEGIVRAFDSSKGAAVRLWLDNEVGTIPLVGSIMKKALEKVLFNDKINIDTMDTDAIIGLVEAAFGSDSILGKYVDSYKGELIDSLRTYLDKVNTVISCTMYDANGKVLDTDSFRVCVQESTAPYAAFIPNGTHITNKQDLPTTVAKGSKLQLSACTTPTRLHMGVIYSVKSTSIFTDGKVVATVDDSGLVTFKNTGTVTIVVSPDTDGFIQNLLKYVNYIYQTGASGTIDSGQVADVLIKYVGIDMNRTALMAILDACFAIKEIVDDTANPVQLTATAVKIIANIILQFTTNDSITFTVVDGVPLTDFDIVGANTVKEGTQIQLGIENTQPVAADTSDITWSSSDPSIASVDPVTGVITGRDAGGNSFLDFSQQTVQITATSAANNVSKTVTITVTKKTGRYLSDIELTADKDTINIGEDQYIHAAVYPKRVAEADNLYIRWGVEIWNEELNAVEYLWATDPYQETDEEGNLLFDEDGNPVMNDGSVTDGIGRIDSLGHYYADAGGTCTIACKAETGYYVGDGNFYQISEVTATKNIDNGQPVESISLSAIDSTGGSALVNVPPVEIDGETLKYAVVQIKVGDANVTYTGKGIKVKADIMPENATNKKLHWFIDNNNFEINNQDDAAGTVEVKLPAGNEKAQSVNIYCVSDDGEIKSDTITLCVARNYATDNKILGDELSLINGKTMNVEHQVTFGGSLTGDNSACRNANWYSSDDDILEISSVDSSTGNAVVRGVDVGVVTLYCVSTDGGIVDSKTVTVYPDKSRLSEIVHLCEKTAIHKTAENAADYKTYMKVLNYAYYILEDEPLAAQTTVDTYADELLYIFYKLGGYIGLNSITILDSNGNKAEDHISVKVNSVLYTNASYKLGYILNPLGGMYSSIEWKSSDENSVKVDRYGKCTPVSNNACYATITVTATDYMGTVVTDSVVVAFAKTPVTGVTINPDSIPDGKADGEPQQLKAVVSPSGISGASITDVVWETSDENVAKVDENGLVTFVYGGECVITATSKDGGYVGKCAVHVDTNYDKLQELINTYTSLSLSPENYYPESYEAYQAKLAEAQNMINANKSSQNEVNKMYSELEEAYKGLKKYTYIQRVEVYLDGEATSDFYQYDLSVFKEGINYTRAKLDLNVRLYPNNASYSSVRWEASTDKIYVDRENGTASPSENESCYGRITCIVTDHFGQEFRDDVWVSFAFVPVTGVSINPSEISGELGKQQQLIPTVYPTGDSLTHFNQASIRDVYWESDNEEVATVDATGLVTFTGAGVTTVRVVAYDGGFSAECKVSVEGDRTALNAALAKYADVDYMDYEYSYGINFKNAYEKAQAAVSDKTLNQSEIDNAASMLNAAGAALAGHEFKKAKTITIKYDNQYHTLGVKWNSRGTGTVDSAAEFYTYKGESNTYNSRVILDGSIPAEAASNYSAVSWSVISKSDNTNVSIDGSKLTINASSASRSAKAVLQLSATDTYGRVITRTIRVVVASSVVTGISLDKTSVTQYANAGTFQINASVTPNDAKVTEVLWSSSDESIATVDENGVVTPRNTGSCVIIAETFDGGYKATCNVTFTTDYSKLAIRYSELMDFYTETKDTHTYTHSSLAVLEQTLLQANKIINESVASQADVELMISKLNDAYDNLILFVPVEDVAVSLVSSDNASSPNDGFIRYAATSINGASLKLSAKVLPETVEGVGIEWSSSSESITVDQDGLVKKTGASSEYAVITAKATDEVGNVAEKKVYVSFVRTAATGVSFDNEPPVFGAPTTTKALSTTVSSASRLAPPSITDCLYSSANPEIASVDENGVVTFVSSGETVITATSIDGGYTATIRAVTTNDSTALAAAIEQYQSVNYMDYEYSYGMAFKAAYENAVEVCNDYTATQQAIDNALVQLQTAYNELTDRPFIAPGDVTIYSGDMMIEDGNSYVKNADNQLVLTAKYADGAMIKSAEFTFENANNVTAEIVDGQLVVTKANDAEYGSIDVTYTVIDEYDRETVVSKSIKIIDKPTLIESFRFVYNGEEVDSVSAKSLVLSTLNVQLSINTYPEAAEAYQSIEWSSSNSKLVVDQNGLVKLSGTATATNYTATITCTVTLSDGTKITNSIPVTFTRGR